MVGMVATGLAEMVTSSANVLACKPATGASAVEVATGSEEVATGKAEAVTGFVEVATGKAEAATSAAEVATSPVDEAATGVAEAVMCNAATGTSELAAMGSAEVGTGSEAETREA